MQQKAQKAAKLKLPNFYVATFLKGSKVLTITSFSYDETEVRRFADEEIKAANLPGTAAGLPYGGYALASIVTLTVADLEKGLEDKIENTANANSKEKNKIMAAIIKSKDAETLQKMISHFTPQEVAYMQDQINK